jgi:hypothetical protein
MRRRLVTDSSLPGMGCWRCFPPKRSRLGRAERNEIAELSGYMEFHEILQ